MEQNNDAVNKLERYLDARQIYEPSGIKCFQNFFIRNNLKGYIVKQSTVQQDRYDGVDYYIYAPNGIQLCIDSKAVNKDTRDKYWKTGKSTNYCIKRSSFERDVTNRYYAFADYDMETFKFVDAHFIIPAEYCNYLIEKYGKSKAQNGMKPKKKDDIAYYLLPREVLLKNAAYITIDGTLYHSSMLALNNKLD